MLLNKAIKTLLNILNMDETGVLSFLIEHYSVKTDII